MNRREAAKVFTIPAGLPFLPTLAEALLAGRLVDGYAFDGDPLSLSAATIYVPTRRAARALRNVFVDLNGGRAAILPVIRPLGEFDEDEALFEPGAAMVDLAPPIASVDRLLLLAPLVRLWKSRLPSRLVGLFEEEVVVPASAADAIWLARDLAALMDEMEIEGGDWGRLAGLVSGDLAGWWQVTLDFLAIVSTHWPVLIGERSQSSPAAFRNAALRAEADRLRRNPPPGPVVAAGSTGSIPATAELLQVIAGLPRGAVVLPGLTLLDEESWTSIADKSEPSAVGHPQYGMAKLLGRLGVDRHAVIRLGSPAAALENRLELVSQALRPAATTDGWARLRSNMPDEAVRAALSGVVLAEAAHERDEALAIAVALRQALLEEGKTAALVTGDRDLARRVSAELLRFGIRADDSGGTLLARSAPATLLRLLIEVAFRPGDPVALLSLVKHPLLALGAPRKWARQAASAVELVVLRGGTGRPDAASLAETFERRLAAFGKDRHPPFWLARLRRADLAAARTFLEKLSTALKPLVALRRQATLDFSVLTRATIEAFEAIGSDEEGDLARLYQGDSGQKLADFLRALVAAAPEMTVTPQEWPDVVAALIGPEIVKPARGGDGRIAIWGALEARLQTVDTLVLGGLNEGSWPRRAEPDRFMSRLMKAEVALEPPERRIGLAAHDFWMAMGAENVVLSRSARAGDAPAVASRWLQRLMTFAGPDCAAAMRERGERLIGWARSLDAGRAAKPLHRPNPRPALVLRPRRFSVTEIETLRRDPYAIYARRILRLEPLDGLLRDPGAAERGTLFHAIMHRFSEIGPDPFDPAAEQRLLAIGRTCFAQASLPPDVEAVWWPRFVALAPKIVGWERRDRQGVSSRHPEERAQATEVGRTGTTLAGRADRIDMRGKRRADIIDFKTGSSPSKAQAHTLLAPQLALEAALMKRGAFEALGPLEPVELAFVRFRPRGDVEEESILKLQASVKSAPALADEAWARLEQLFAHYRLPETGYLSRSLPFREADMDGDYDHLARVLEWSAGAADEADAEGGE